MASSESSPNRPSRRSLLAGVAGAVATSGCVDRLRAIASRSSATPISFEIKTMPADEDPFAMLIARQLVDWFQSAGLNASVLPVAGDELLRQVLITKEYDAFVAQFPGTMTDPDALYGLLHSSYAAEPGWQNPFGYSSLSTDEELERQRVVDGTRRRETAASLQETIVEHNPFTVLAFPDFIAATREDRFTGLTGAKLRDPRGYFPLVRTDSDDETLRVATTDFRPTTDLNPLNAEYRRDGLFTGFLYEPLAFVDDELTPWLASEITWDDGDASTARITLREDATWHDGRDLTTEDVAFTYAFLQDTSLDDGDDALPVTRYREESSLVTDVDIHDDVTATLQFRDGIRDVTRRSLLVPILPRHVWNERTDRVGGGTGRTTAALVTDNIPAVGSGPLEFERAQERDRLVLTRFEDHFSNRDPRPDLPPPFADGISFEELVVQFVGSDATAVELVTSDDVDATVTSLGPDVVPRIGRQDAVDLNVSRSGSFYFAGYNAQRPPFSNTRFRALLGRLIDRAFLVSTVFDGYATPAVSPLDGTEWLPSDLAWKGEAPIGSFIGDDGTVAVDRVRDHFTDAGFRIDDRGRVLRN